MRGRVDPRTWPWWVQVLVVYGLARAFSAAVFVRVATHQVANGWTGADPSYADYVGRMFDATWYLHIAENGYPHTLPLGQDGAVQQNAWAFYPLFPLVLRALMAVTGLSWTFLAPTVSLLLGAGAVLVIYRLVQRGGHRATALVPGLPLATVLLVSVFPSSPVLQTAYTEALALLLIASALYLLAVRRYFWAVPVVVLLGFTRAVALPMACVVVWHVLWRVWGAWGPTARRHPDRAARDRFSVRDVGALGTLLGTCLVAGVAWQVIAGRVTGRSDAYFATQAAWRSGSVHYFTPWVTNAKILFHDRGPLVLAVVLVVLGLLALSPVAFRLGPELQGWTIAYTAYLVLVTDPWTSTWRFALLAFPYLAILVGWARRRWVFGSVLTVLVLLSLYGQVDWVWELWRFKPPADWAP
ncbi:hypothetical protein GCM10023221_00780 [Luteimicrobium xylanilyticum]|uniref:Integral membrane protein n=1 Tax=Luteimicrobium xylanilyticum TaxID=1133546 RepID=A0A5P9QB14_9MICO|nr:hypothetical protein [Luteimicrobium xylanilyticum]QFU97625.1 hypothetical protein KDY119_01124 [Luteimicrobium xylanilyticum]